MTSNNNTEKRKYEKKEKCPVPLSTLKRNYDVANSNYTKIHRKMKILDAADRSRLWQAISAKFPKWQIQPDSNWVSYIKSNLIASIYTVTKGASLLPTSDDDREAIEHLNVALEYIWDIADVGYYQMQAGSNAALFNLGVTQVGWDAEAQGGKGNTYYKGDVVLKNINPMHYMRDPFAEDLDSAAYVITFENMHKTAILGNPRYNKAFQDFLDNKRAEAALGASQPDPVYPLRDVDPSNVKTDTDYYKVITYFVKYNGDDGKIKIAEIHTLDNDLVLWYKKEIKPNRFPFVELFCNLPEGDVVGTSECAKILSNNIAYNMINSMLLTGIYRNYHPTKFISSASGLNIATFSKFGNEPDKMFVVNGDASRAVHYLDQPQPTAFDLNAQAMLANDVQKTSGVDARYTGRDTGSVLTTGGVEDMLDRVTVIDTPKIKNYERYTKQLTQLILSNFVEFSMKRTYFKKDIMKNTYDSFEVDYKALSKDTLFHYAINISSELPKNKQRVAAMANTLMEKQMQYGQNQKGPDLITTEEWLQLQDIPFKELMQKRMGIQRVADATAKFTRGLFDYASFVANGTDPNAAVEMVGENIAANETGKDGPYEVPPLENLVEAQQGIPEAGGAPMSADPMQAMQQDPTALLQQAAQSPGASKGMQIDPQILEALGNFA
jgi:hypothetical protein